MNIMTGILLLPLRLVKLCVLSVIFCVANICFTVMFTLKYIYDGEYLSARLILGIVYLFLLWAFSFHKILFIVLMGIAMTFELYGGLREAVDLLCERYYDE